MARTRRRHPRSGTPTTPGLQQVHLRYRFPGFSCYRRNGQTIWRGTLQPRLVSPAYEVEVRFKPGGVPTVWVLSPPLVAGAPHTYQEGNLCLYSPKEWKWQPDSVIAETILPWAAVWLLYYELWLDTGEWLGPSTHGSSKERGE